MTEKEREREKQNLILKQEKFNKILSAQGSEPFNFWEETLSSQIKNQGIK